MSLLNGLYHFLMQSPLIHCIFNFRAGVAIFILNVQHFHCQPLAVILCCLILHIGIRYHIYIFIVIPFTALYCFSGYLPIAAESEVLRPH